MSTSTSNRTKDWLKNQLVSHGVPLPSSSARKEEYQRLYEEQVLPQQNNTEFSSDDDTEQVDHQPSPSASPVVKNTKAEMSKGEALSPEEKRLAWVGKMTDQNLFDALSALERNPGPIVDSTRDFYKKKLLELLSEDQEKVLEKIEEYLAQQPEAREHWLSSNLSLHGLNGVANGNGENGFSDTDDDDAVETASRASRASSKRATPARTPRSPTKAAGPSTPVSAARSGYDADIRPRRVTALARDGLFDLTNDSDETEELPAASTSDSLFNRVSSPGYSKSKPTAYRRRMVDTYEETRTYRESSGISLQQRAESQGNQVPVQKSRKRLVFYLLLVFLIAAMGYAYYVLRQTSECSGQECNTDELDLILKNLDEDVQNDVGAGGDV